MFFGLFNTFTSFQKYINKIMAEKFNIFFIINLNNIFIYMEDFKQTYVKKLS